MNEKVANILNFVTVRKKLIIRITIGSFIFIFLLFTDYGFIKTFSLMIDKSELNHEIKIQESINDSLNRRIKILTKDSLEIERIAREHYGLVKKGEDVFISAEK